MRYVHVLILICANLLAPNWALANAEAFDFQLKTDESKLQMRNGIIWKSEDKVSVSNFQEHLESRYEIFKFLSRVEGEDGKTYYLQWLFARIRLDETADPSHQGWKNGQMYSAQVIISQGNQAWKQQRNVRGGIGEAGVFNQPLRFWVDNWSFQSRGNSSFPADIRAITDDFSMHLAVKRKGNYFTNIDSRRKLDEQSQSIIAYEINAPFIDVEGQLTLNGKQIKVKGGGWIKKQWGDNIIAEPGLKKVFFDFKLFDGSILSFIRYSYSEELSFIIGTVSDKQGNLHTISEEEITIRPLTYTRLTNGFNLPLSWSVQVPEYGINLITRPITKEVWAPFWIPHWQGPLYIEGSHKGRGFMQLGGYF